MRIHAAAIVGALLVGAATDVDAQACVGLPEHGTVKAGIEGFDAATGFGAALSLNKPSRFVQLQYESLSHFTIIDPLKTVRFTFGRPISNKGVATCFVTGVAGTFYQTEYLIGKSWSSADPDHVYEQHGIGGGYRRLRVPIGIALGREVALFRRVSVTPFVVQSLVAEHEHADETVRSTLGKRVDKAVRSTLGASTRAGLSMSLGGFLLHSELSRTMTSDRTLSRASDGLSISFHAGVRL